MTETWFTSDTHFGHRNIIEYCNRPFDSVDDMNEALVTYWNETVGINDTVIHVGDFAMGKIADTLPIVGMLNGEILLVPGNHDRCWEGVRKGQIKWCGKYLDAGFSGILGSTTSWWEFLVCHFPYVGDSRHEERYSEWRPADFGAPLIHGHVHDIWQVNGNQINVGTDVWNYRPVNIDTIRTLAF